MSARFIESSSDTNADTIIQRNKILMIIGAVFGVLMIIAIFALFYLHKIDDSLPYHVLLNP